MRESLGETPTTGFHTLSCMCEGVGRDSGYVMSDLISCMIKNIPSVNRNIVWNVDDCGVPLHAHFRWGVALVGNSTTGHCSPRKTQLLGGTTGDEAHPGPQM